jgi:predicted SAM-dependent methyltransferase
MTSESSVDVQAVGRYMREAFATGTNPSDPPALKLAKRFVPHGMRDQLRALATAAVRPRAKRKIESFGPVGSLKLNLGSGYARAEGYINIDLAGAPNDLTWDLSKGIPFPDGSAQMVYSAHVLEHVPLPGAITLLEECARVLRSGGLIRIVVPDAGLLLGSYAGTNDASWAHAFPTRMLAVNALFYEHGHRTMWDAELMIAALKAVGFDDVTERRYQDTALSPCPDDESRRDGSLFVEGKIP